MGFLNNDNWPISVLFCRSFDHYLSLNYSILGYGESLEFFRNIGYFDGKGVPSSQNLNNIHSLKYFFRSFIERRHLFGI